MSRILKYVFIAIPFLFLIISSKRKEDEKDNSIFANTTLADTGSITNTDTVPNRTIWDTIRYFQPYEFDSPDAVGSGEFMNPNFMRMLDECRHRDGKPWNVNSGYRTKDHNGKIGGVMRSSHTKFIAADIACNSKQDLIKRVKIARDLGFKRIGQYHTKAGNWFIHLDIDETKPQNEWAYENWGGGDGRRVDLFASE